jgi:hypothetical protein
MLVQKFELQLVGPPGICFLLSIALVYPFEPAATIDGESAEPPRLLDRLRFALRANHNVYRTEHPQLNSARRLIRHDGKRHR